MRVGRARRNPVQKLCVYTGQVEPSRYTFTPSPIEHQFSLNLSGCGESNSDYIHPMDAYYHYTTPR